jgi:pimeloyl-ACP methyl ester carboxylesterase
VTFNLDDPEPDTSNPSVPAADQREPQPAGTEQDPPPVSLDPGDDPGVDTGASPSDPEQQPSDDSIDSTLIGECCSDGNCLCHGPAPTAPTDRDGSFRTASLSVDTGTLFYPEDAEPPFAGLAICAGFLNTGREILDWGQFFASHGIVTLVTTTNGADFPAVRASKLAASIEELKSMDAESGTPVSGRMSGRYGTSGYSMGGGGTTIATTNDKSLLSSVGLAPWEPTGRGVVTPTLLMCGSTDGTAPCSMAEGAYREIPETTPKMVVELPRVGHLAWLGGPTGVDDGGALALAFNKLYLEGDERWRSILLGIGGNLTTNIAP